MKSLRIIFACKVIRGGAGKSLAWPGRKQATATKLGIYSTCSPRSSTHLAHCSIFCKPLKRIQKAVLPTRSPQQQWPPRKAKNGELSIVFSVQGTGDSPTGPDPDPENRVGDQDSGGPGRPVSSGLQVPGEPGHCRAWTSPSWWPSCGIFASKCPSIAPHQQRWVTCRVDSLALWKIINEEDNVFIQKNRGENFSSRFLHSEVFGAGWAAIPPLHWLLLLLCLRVIVI